MSSFVDELEAKLNKIGDQLKILRERELKKSLIPVHNHHPGTIAGAGVEDVPPGKLKKAVKCMKCGEMHEPLSKCGKVIKTDKAELVDPKGKLSSNSVKTPFKGNDSKEVKAKGSGGDTKAGKGLEKALTAGGGNVAPSPKVNDLGKSVLGGGLPSVPPAAPAGNKTPALAAMRARAAGAPAPRPSIGGGSKTPALDAMRAKAAGAPVKPTLKAEAPADTQKADPPMAKPPSGKNMATHVPSSAPKQPAMKKELEKGMFADAARTADPVSHAASKVAAVNAAVPKLPKVPSQAQHAQRAASYGSAMAGEFQPKGPVSSGLELAGKPKLKS